MKKDELIRIIKQKHSAPFLFLGSGFTKHYLDTPDWEGLLQKFASKHLNSYTNRLGTRDLTVVASEIASEVSDVFWNLPEDDQFKVEFQDKAVNTSSVLKYKISEYLKTYSLKELPEQYEAELDLLRAANIDGIITTNWDDFVDRLFPKFKTFIGQDELIFSPTYNVGEIYKIHGSIYQSESLVLTQEDYKDYNERNIYLVSKLTTMFVEHPIFFMGYSISDNNVQEILEGIVKCLNKEMISKLQNNLFFVEWNSNPDALCTIEKYDILMSNSLILPVTRINTHSYKDVYECLSFFNRQIPAHLLRIYKQNFYKIVISENPENQLFVLDDKSLDKVKDLQFVFGFGAIDKYKSAIGYTGLKSINIFKDIIYDTGNYEPEQILTKTLPELRKVTPFIPCYKYLRALGITNNEEFANNQLGINIKLLSGKEFRPSYSDPSQYIQGKTIIDIIRENPAWKAAIYITYVSKIERHELPTIRDFCEKNYSELIVKKKPNHATFFKRLICLYDWLLYGW